MLRLQKRTEKVRRDYDHYLYRLRSQPEDTFYTLCAGIALRCTKNTFSFTDTVQIRCILLLAAILSSACVSTAKVKK